MTGDKNGSLLPPYYTKVGGSADVAVQGDIDYPFEDISGSGDENKIRGNWSAPTDFLLAAFGLVCGTGNLWTFPYYCYHNGGAAFLIPYVLMMILLCLPILVLELSLGQFSSLACTAIWKVCPLFKGIGIGMVLVSCVLCMYNNVFIAWSVQYLVSSIRPTVPWVSCRNEWNTDSCSEWSMSSISDCRGQNGTLLRSGYCASDEQLVIMQNASEAEGKQVELSRVDVDTPWTLINRTLPSHEYFYNHVLSQSEGVWDIGTIQWQLCLYLLLAWVITFFALFKSVKTSGKVAYVTVIVPYISMLVLFVRAMTRDGAIHGLLYFLEPKWEKLLEPQVWGTAACQAFYSVSLCWGSMATLSSYNKFHNNIFRDAWLICLVDVITSCFCAVLAYATIGYMTLELHWPMETALYKGPALVFVMYMEALARLSVAPIWSAFFFLTVILIAIDTQIFLVETVVSSLCDEFAERLRKNHRHVLSLTCLIFYACGVAFCTQAGIYLIDLMDRFLCTYTLIILAFFECMTICWVYGIDNLLDNIKWMTYYYPPPYILWKLVCKFLSPCLILATLISVWYGYRTPAWEEVQYPMWAVTAGWVVSMVPIAMIPLCIIVQCCIRKGSLVQRVSSLMTPDDDWGPALAIHRAEQFPLQIPEANYTRLLYCSPSWAFPGLVVLLCFLLLQLFIALAVAADTFFCPNVNVIVQHLSISHNIAGVTLLAFGNGSPDIFSSIASVLSSSAPKPGLAIGALLGAAMFVSTVVVSMVTLVRPFDVMRRPLIRDLMFFVVTCAWLLYVLIRGQLTALQSISFIVLYIVYAIVVIVGRFIRIRVNRRAVGFAEFVDEDADSINETEPDLIPDVIPDRTGQGRQTGLIRQDSLVEEALWHYNPHPNHQHNTPLPSISEITQEESNEFKARKSSTDCLVQLWRGLRVWSKQEWAESSYMKRAMLVIKVPCSILLRVSIPLVDDDLPQSNWSKPLLVLQCVLCPIMALFALKDLRVLIGDIVPVWLICLTFGVLCACAIHVGTKDTRPPKYHKFLAWFGFLMAVLWIYCIAREVVGVVTAVGVLSRVSEDVLGLTLVAWSNSLGDLVADVAVAKQGFPRMAISACFGGPLFNILLGFGIAFTIVTVQMDHDLVVELTAVRKVLIAFVLWSLLSSLIMLPLSRFRASRPYAVYLLVVYFVFMVTVILTEKGVINIPG